MEYNITLTDKERKLVLKSLTLIQHYEYLSEELKNLKNKFCKIQEEEIKDD